MSEEKLIEKVDEPNVDPQNISPEEMEIDKVIDSIVNHDNEDVKAALKELKDWYMSVHLSKYENVIASLNSLLSLIGGNDRRVVQLINQINSVL